MDAAKNAVKNIIHRGGQHDTTVDENVASAVTSETVKPHRHEEITQAIDREVHQDHYHTTVQPLQHKEVLPEKHTHQQMPIQEKEIHHGDHDRVRSGVESESAQFANTSRVAATTESTSTAAAATGEHVHHHVHETVQPVIHKETIQPEVVHTTIPIHETHHAQPEHHGMSTLPTKTLSEFKELGGKITGASHRHEEYEGHPRPYNPEMQSSRGEADINPSAHDGLHGSHSGTGHHTGHHTSHTGTGMTGGLTGTYGSGTTGDLSGTGTTGGLTGTHGSHNTSGTHGSGTTGGLSGTGTNVSGVGNTGSDYNTGSGYTSGNAGSVSRAVDSATGHGSSHHGSSGIDSNTSRGLGDNTTGHNSTGGTGTHHNTGYTDNSSSTNTANTGSSGGLRDDVQSPRQGKDPNLVESETTRSAGLKGEGVPGSHSAVFGLTPDGKKYNDTEHGTTALKPAHSSKLGDSSSGYDNGSRVGAGSGVAQQMDDLRVGEKGHSGSGVSAQGSGKPGAGSMVPEQGFGHVRGQEHGGSVKMQDKLDPRSDADGDGKKGFMD